MEHKVAIYTAIFGDYEILQDSIIVPGCDYICFTDNKNLKSNIWDIRYVKPNKKIPSAIFYKKFKCLSHKYLPQYEYTIWIDANFIICNSNLLDYCIYNCKSDKLLLFKHKCPANFHRYDLYQEAYFSMGMKKYKDEPLKDQIQFYQNQGIKPQSGLYNSGFLYRKNHDKDVIQFNEFWLKEIEKWSVKVPQCQVSLPYVLQKLNMKFDILKIKNIYNCGYFNEYLHGSTLKIR